MGLDHKFFQLSRLFDKMDFMDQKLANVLLGVVDHGGPLSLFLLQHGSCAHLFGADSLEATQSSNLSSLIIDLLQIHHFK